MNEFKCYKSYLMQLAIECALDTYCIRIFFIKYKVISFNSSLYNGWRPTEHSSNFKLVTTVSSLFIHLLTWQSQQQEYSQPGQYVEYIAWLSLNTIAITLIGWTWFVEMRG